MQNLLLKTGNVVFQRAKCYSASTHKTYLAPLPPGYEGGFGPDLKALVLSLHHLGNPLFTTYTTLPKKDRRAVLTALLNGQPLPFLLTPDVLASDAVASMPRKWRRVLSRWPLHTVWDEETVIARLDSAIPTLSSQARKRLVDEMAVAGYHPHPCVPTAALLPCADAPQFPGLTQDLGLCWVHDARHYQKLLPHLPLHRETLEAFQERYWKYYDRLLAYREHPDGETRERLWEDFDTLLRPETGYAHLDYRIQQSLVNKDKLLQVLSHPEIPLHNNASELAVRRRVRKRDVSFGPRTPAGVRAWDTFQTIAATAQKLGVSFIAYVAARGSGRNEMPSLASSIAERACEMNLGASWA